MARKITMSETVNAVKDALVTVNRAYFTDESATELRIAAFNAVLREYLDNDYVRDLAEDA